MKKDQKSEQAAAELYRLAQAAALLRRYRESEGHDAPSCEALAEWVQAQIEPSPADYEAVNRAHPDLVLLAGRSPAWAATRGSVVNDQGGQGGQPKMTTTQPAQPG